MQASDTDLTADYFTLLHLPRTQVQDLPTVDANFRELQSRVHPDKHAHATAADQRLAMQWATRVNEAYQAVKSPLLRARYLLQLLGHDLATESNTAMPAEFLMAQMDLREAVEDAKAAQVGAGEMKCPAAGTAQDAINTLEALDAELRRQMRDDHSRLAELIDAAHDYAAAAQLVRQLMFQEKLRAEIADALDAVHA